MAACGRLDPRLVEAISVVEELVGVEARDKVLGIIARRDEAVARDARDAVQALRNGDAPRVLGRVAAIIARARVVNDVHEEHRGEPGKTQLRRLLQSNSVRALAARCGTSTASISRWANGRREPDESGRSKLALLGIAESCDWLPDR